MNDGGLNDHSKSMLDGMSSLGIGENGCDLAGPRIKDVGRGNSVQNRPLLGGKREYLDLLAMRSNVATKRIGTTDISSVLETRDAGAGNCEGTNLDMPEGVPPGSAGILGCPSKGAGTVDGCRQQLGDHCQLWDHLGWKHGKFSRRWAGQAHHLSRDR